MIPAAVEPEMRAIRAGIRATCIHDRVVSLALTRRLLAAALAATCAACHPHSTAPSPSVTSQLESGIYGFSGAGVPDTEPEGVVGECVWIFDENNSVQVARGECAERAPGKFHVALKPGRYVVRGPGGNQRVEVKPGAWVKLESVASLPLAP